MMMENKLTEPLSAAVSWPPEATTEDERRALAGHFKLAPCTLAASFFLPNNLSCCLLLSLLKSYPSLDVVAHQTAAA